MNTKTRLKNLIEVAAGRKKADLVLKNARVLNVFTGEWISGDVAIADGLIAGVGDYAGKEEIDLAGKFVAPGFIDTHLHIESTMLTPVEFLRIAVAHGTTTFLCDPHEIANVCGLDGVDFMIREAQEVPCDAKFMLPSCVPATPFEDNGYKIGGAETRAHVGEERFFGLGEFMDYPGVISGAEEPLEKIAACKDAGKPVDGHCMLGGKSLTAYAAAGIRTDHECTTVAEMREKLRAGMYVQIREGSATRNLETLVQGLTPRSLRRCVLCTDDRTAKDLLTVGHLDKNIRLGIACGVAPEDMLTMATLNAAECYGFADRGAVAAGRRADLAVIGDLAKTDVQMVFVQGKLVAKEGKALFDRKKVSDARVKNTLRFPDLTAEKLSIPLTGTRARVMRLLPKNVLTESLVREVCTSEGKFAFGGEDVLKLAVAERHKNTGKVGLGLIEGYGLKGGAAAITVAHDSHNLIVVGDSDEDMCLAANRLKTLGGGMALVRGGKVVAEFPLEVAGLMSERDAAQVAAGLERMSALAHEMGVPREIEPFMCLSFLSLAVIPALKVTASGLFDVEKFRFTSVDAERE